MKTLRQFAVILLISFAGELLRQFIPLPIPASVYGLVLMLICLCSGLIKVNDIKETSMFLIEIMSVMFIPAAVGLTDSWQALKPIIWPVILTILFTTVLVMVITGRVTQHVIQNEKGAQK